MKDFFWLVGFPFRAALFVIMAIFMLPFLLIFPSMIDDAPELWDEVVMSKG